MDMNKVPINELRKLLTAVSEQGNHHLQHTEADLKQAAYLLNEAVDKLGASFLTLDEKLKSQQALLQTMRANGQLPAQASIDIDGLQSEINGHVQQVVTNLQFQDMTNQIIERSLNRLGGLKSLLVELSHHSDHADVCLLHNEKQEIDDYIESLNKSINDGSDAIEGGISRQSVNQTTTCIRVDCPSA